MKITFSALLLLTTYLTVAQSRYDSLKNSRDSLKHKYDSLLENLNPSGIHEGSFTPFPENTTDNSCYDRFGLMVYVDQDMFYPKKNEDRNYTMGVSLGVSGKMFEGISPLHWLGEAKRNMSISRWEKKSKAGLSRYDSVRKSRTDWKRNDLEHGKLTSITLGYGAFTPLDIGSTAPVEDDRPYGGILALSFNRTFFQKPSHINSDSRQAFYQAFAIGLLGTNIGNKFQSWVHERNLKSGKGTRPIPVGWHNQISDGGELTGLLTLGHKRLLSTSENFYTRGTWKAIAMHEVTVGYYTNVTAGLATTFGHLKEWYNFNISPTNYVNQVIAEEDMPRIFAFASARMQYVIYNALLQGQFKDNPHELTTTEVSDWVFITDFGVNVWFPIGLTARVQFTRRSAEYTINNQEGRAHYWGSIYLNYNLPCKKK